MFKYAHSLCDTTNTCWHDHAQWDLTNYATFMGDRVHKFVLPRDRSATIPLSPGTPKEIAQLAELNCVSSKENTLKCVTCTKTINYHKW